MISEDQNGNEKINVGGGGLKTKPKMQWAKSVLAIALVSLVGGFLVWSTFATSSNAYIGQVEAQYQALLGRPADPGGLTYWTNQMAKGKSINDVINGIKGTNEYKNKQNQPSASTTSTPTNPYYLPPGTTKDYTTFVQGLYTNVLKKSVDPAGLSYWVNQLESGAKTEAQVENFFKSKVTPQASPNTSTAPAGESNALYIIRIYQELAGKHPSSALDYWLSKMPGTGDGTWSKEKIYTHIKNSDGAKKYALNMQDPTFVEKENIKKTIEKAYDDLIREHIANGGKLQRTWLSQDPNCTGTLINIEKGLLPKIPYDCYGGSGIIPEPEPFINAVLNGTLTLDQALAAIKAKQTINSSSCAFSIQAWNSVCNPSAGPLMSVQELYALNCSLDTSAQLTTLSHTQAGACNNTNSSSSSSRSSTPSTRPAIRTEPKVVDQKNYENSPLTAAILESKSISAPEAAVNACTGSGSGSVCATVPLAQTKASDITKSSKVSTVQLRASKSCKLSEPTLCNDFTQVWNDGGANYYGKDATQKADIQPQQVAACVDQYKELKPGEDSVCVQIARIYLGLTGYLGELEKDKDYDDGMKDSVVKFQEDQELKSTEGTIDKETWNSLKEVANDVQQAKKKTANYQQISKETSKVVQRNVFASLLTECKQKSNTLVVGVQGDCVKRAQQILGVIQGSGIAVTGKFDETTKNAISNFQADRGVNPTGMVDRGVWKLLEFAKESPIHNSPYQAPSGSLMNNRE